MPNKVKNWKIWSNIELFTFFVMELKKLVESHKSEKKQHLIRYFKGGYAHSNMHIFHF